MICIRSQLTLHQQHVIAFRIPPNVASKAKSRMYALYQMTRNFSGSTCFQIAVHSRASPATCRHPQLKNNGYGIAGHRNRRVAAAKLRRLDTTAHCTPPVTSVTILCP